MFVLIYVDEILVTCSTTIAIDGLLHNLRFSLPIKYLGNINYFMGIEATIYSDSILLSQDKYILNLLCKTKIVEEKLVATLMASTHCLHSFDDDPHLNPTKD